jgi:hypothetical protein
MDIQPLALLERELELYVSMNGALYLLTATATHAPYPETILDYKLLLASKKQNVNTHFDDIENALDAAQGCYGLRDLLSQVYANATGADAKNIEKQSADVLKSERGIYLAALLLTTTWEKLSDTGIAICDILDPDADVDGDGISSGDELEDGDSDPFEADTDGDGIPDSTDTCPEIANPDQTDTDGDGTGDLCDNDIDGDGLENGIEDAFGTNPLIVDSDGDGTNDYQEWLHYGAGDAASNHPPEKPAILLPTSGATGIETIPEMVAGSFNDPDTGDNHLRTLWQISKDTLFADLVFQADTSQLLKMVEIPELVLSEGTTYYARVRFFDSYNAESPWSDTVSFTTEETDKDEDNNGIPDAQATDNTLDVDRDNTADNSQTESIKCVNNTFNPVIQVCSKKSTNISVVSAIVSTSPETIYENYNRPADLPAGLVSIRMETAYPGDTAEVLVYFSNTVPADSKWYRYDYEQGWIDYSDNSEPATETNAIILELVDGGYGDCDGVENGVIVTMGGIDAIDDTRVAGTTGSGGNSGGGGGGGGCFISKTLK